MTIPDEFRPLSIGFPGLDLRDSSLTFDFELEDDESFIEMALVGLTKGEGVAGVWLTGDVPLLLLQQNVINVEPQKNTFPLSGRAQSL